MRDDLNEIFNRYLSNAATEADMEQLFELFGTADEDELRLLIGAALDGEVVEGDHSEKLRFLYGEIQKRIAPQKTVRLWPRIVAAASVILVLSVGGYFLLHKQKPQQVAANFRNDIKPGHNQATLTLANGKKIILTKGLSGLLAVQGNSTVKVTQDSDIRYSVNNQQESQISYNTLSTVRGEASPYPLVLADGTKVWLNAESSITFPTAFTGKERLVTVSGEAYVEVKHDERKPFKIRTSQMLVEDIGTKFDISSYSDEKNNTTLVEGKVKVNNLVIEPGQQTDGSKVKIVKVGQVLAWKNNDFDFENDNIQTIMRQLSRWYDIDVNYEGNISTESFNAQISRNRNISVILKALERTGGVHFKIEGRRVTVIR